VLPTIVVDATVKQGAAGGTIAWAAPLTLATTLVAVGTEATLACVPQAGGLSLASTPITPAPTTSTSTTTTTTTTSPRTTTSTTAPGTTTTKRPGTTTTTKVLPAHSQPTRPGLLVRILWALLAFISHALGWS